MLEIIGFIVLVLFALWTAKVAISVLCAGVYFGAMKEAIAAFVIFGTASVVATWLAVVCSPFKITFGA